MELGQGTGVYTPTTPCEPDAPLAVDFNAARAVGEWFGFVTAVLEQLREEAGADDTPSRVQLWPEHFDIAVDLGPDGRRANYGGSPGDAGHPEPYLYVGPVGQPAAGGRLLERAVRGVAVARGHPPGRRPPRLPPTGKGAGHR